MKLNKFRADESGKMEAWGQTQAQAQFQFQAQAQIQIQIQTQSRHQAVDTKLKAIGSEEIQIRRMESFFTGRWH